MSFHPMTLTDSHGNKTFMCSCGGTNCGFSIARIAAGELLTGIRTLLQSILLTGFLTVSDHHAEERGI